MLALAKKDIIPFRGYLIHLTHYDPEWCKRKSREKPFDLNLGLEIIEALSDAGFNLLIIDCADGVKYKSHPELARRYSIPMSCLKQLVNRAQKHNIEIVPKLNFSHSSFHRHNYWFRPYNTLFDNDDYWRIAFEIIDELIEACRPKRYFHVGMDEDHDRDYAQYIEAISRLRKELKQRGLRTIIWNDSSQIKNPLVDAKKSLEAEKEIPKDIVQIAWDYEHVRPKIIQRLVEEGFEVWVAPSQDPKQVLQWKRAILKYGGKGMVMTTWIPCRGSNRSKMLKLIKNVGPIYCSPE
jgi:hypothetical protein